MNIQAGHRLNTYKQKKNCNRCKAFLRTGNGSAECRLGYRLELQSYDEYGFTSYGVPLEPCPKPLTYIDYLHRVGLIDTSK